MSIHNPKAMSIKYENGHDLLPGTATSLAIQEINHMREERPYKSNCSDSWDTTNYTDYISNISQIPYSYHQCTRVCSHTSILLQCNCVHPLFVDPGISTEDSPPCNLNHKGKDNNSFFLDINAANFFVSSP